MNMKFNEEAAVEMKRWFASKDFEQQYDYDGNDLGVVYKETETTFKVWAPTASAVSVNLYHYGSYAMAKCSHGVWQIIICEDLEGVYYTFSVIVSNDVHSGISEKYRGKYLAFTENNTSIDDKGKFPTCMAYLKALGVRQQFVHGVMKRTTVLAEAPPLGNIFIHRHHHRSLTMCLRMMI